MECYPWSLDQLAKRYVSFSNGRYSDSYLRFVAWAFRGILTAVDEVHSLGYVHRDLKLDNFMVDSSCTFLPI